MSAFQRLVPTRGWFRGTGLAALLWSIAAALLAGAAVVTFALLIDVLAGDGDVTLPGAELQAIEPDPASPLRRGTPGEISVDQIYLLHDQGLLATALRYRDRAFHRLLLAACRQFPLLRDNAAAAVILILLLAVFGVARSIALARLHAAGWRRGMESAAQLRQSIHRQALRLTPGDLAGRARQTTLELFTREVDRVANGVGQWMTRAPEELFLLLTLLVLAVLVDGRLTLQCIVPIGIAWWMTYYERSRSQRIRDEAELTAETGLRTLAEGLRKSRLVRGYGMENFEAKQFQQHLERYSRDIARSRAKETWAIWTARGCTVLCAALVLFFVSARVLSTLDPLPLSAGVLLLVVLARAGSVVRAFRGLKEARRDIEVIGDKVYRYLAEIPEVGQAVGAKFLEPVSKSIILESVSYRVDGVDVLKNCDLRIPARTSTALISLDPIERRAAAFLLPRFIEPVTGRVLFDSEDTAWSTLESLRAETIYVGGSDPFFTGTVLENLTCGDPRFSTPEATEAAKLAHAHNFIQKLSQGYETVIGEHGERLDAGQAFRLGLARAVLRKPAVLVIEEPDSLLDDDTKSLLDDAYTRIMKDRTVIFLPARLSTVRRCDQIVLLRDGRAAAVGTYEALVKQSELYRHWEYVTFKSDPPRARSAGKA